MTLVADRCGEISRPGQFTPEEHPVRVPFFVAVVLFLGSIFGHGQGTEQTRDLQVLHLRDVSTAPGVLAVGLETPADARLVPGGTAGSAQHYATDIQLQTKLTPAEVESTYTRQIAAAGWAVEARYSAGGGRMAGARFAGRSASGDPVTAYLVVTRLDDNTLDVVLRLIRNRNVVPPVRRGDGRFAEAGRGARSSSGQGGNVQAGRGTVAAELMNLLNQRPLLAARGGRPKVVAGPAPDFPAGLLPPGTIIGASARAGEQFTVAGEAPSFPIARLPQFILTLRNDGWTGAPPLLGGFGEASLQKVELCRQGEALSLDVAPREGSGVWVRVALVTAVPADACRQRPIPGRGGRATRAPLIATLALPLLTSPAVEHGRTSGGGGIDAAYSQTRATTTMPVAALAREYARQMQSAGWKPEGSLEDGALFIASFSSTRAEGEPLTGLVSLIQLPDGEVDAWMRVVRRFQTR